MLGSAKTAWAARAWAPTGSVNERRTTAAATLSTFTFTGINGGDWAVTRAEFGAGSLSIVQSDQLIQYSAWSGPFPNGTGDFCIEAWVWIPSGRSNAVTGDPIVNNQSGGLGIRFGQGYNFGGFNKLSLFARGQADLDYADYTWPRESWTHWAVQRKSGTISLWANGNKLTRQGSGGGARNFAAPSSTDLSIGSYNNGGSTDETMRCYIDEMCVSNSWRYDDTQSTYTVPTAAFTVDTITDMLIHFDSSLTTAAS